MTDKKRSNQVDIPSVMLSSDDLKSRVPPAGQTMQSRSEKVQTSAVSPVLIVLIALLFAAMAFLYYQLRLQQQAFEASQVHLEQSLTQVSKLENQDQTLMEAGSNLNKQLAVFESEIRKLWDVANQLRKNDLPGHKKLLDEQRNKLELTLEQLEKIKSNMGAYQKSMDQMEKKYANLAETLKGLDDLQEKTVQLDKSVKALAAKNSAKEISSLKKRMDEIELSIAAIDAHRSQVNRNLDKLTQEVKRLGAGKP